MIIPTSNRLLCDFRLLLLGSIFASMVICGSAPTISAQTLEMTKIVYRRIDPAIKLDSVEAQPRTLYRAGDKYLRAEDPPNPAGKTHILKITREPDAWVINLMDHTARHLIDSGPTFNARAPILWPPKPSSAPDPDKEFMALEFGHEEEFFRREEAHETRSREIDGKDCKALTIKTETREVTLFVDPETGRPVQLESKKDGNVDLALRYLSYETNLPFEPSLFEPPEGLKITEQK